MSERIHQSDEIYMKILRNRIKLHYELQGLDEQTIEIMVALMSDDTIMSLNKVLLNERTQQQ